MKTQSRIWRCQSPSLLFISVVLGCLAFALAPANLLADGFFVIPKFVWDKHKDINEPTQKAIVVHDAGREELILQVKYDGPAEEFGWLIPVPDLPTVKKGSMECYYELSKYTQKHFESLDYAMASSLGAAGKGGRDEAEPPVKVIEIKTVGAYDIAILSTKDAGALDNWLKANQFAVPANAPAVLEAYVKQHWYFVAVKINLKSLGRSSTSEKLASGELHPLQISFASQRCVFPLKISSLNNTPSEVQLYVMSPEPLVEKSMFLEKLTAHGAWRTNMTARREAFRREIRDRRTNVLRRGPRHFVAPPPIPEPDEPFGRMLAVNTGELLPYGQVTAKELPICNKQIGLLGERKSWWLTKQTRTFKPEEMRDLAFELAVPVFAAALADSEGAFAAADLVRLGTNGAAALIAAIQNPSAAVRAHAMSVAEQLYTVAPGERKPSSAEEDGRERYVDASRRVMNPDLVRLLPALLNDTDPAVRMNAIYAATDCPDPKFTARMLELLRDEYTEVSGAAVNYLAQQKDEASEHIPFLRQMLKDTNANVQMVALRSLVRLQAEIPREDLLPLFSVPRMEVAGAAVGRLQREGISCEEAKPLLRNSLWMARLMGLAALGRNANTQSLELAIPLLRDPEDVVRFRARDLLEDLTGQNFPAEQPEQWEEWWGRNKSTFKVNISPEELRQMRLERMRQMQRMETGPPP